MKGASQWSGRSSFSCKRHLAFLPDLPNSLPRKRLTPSARLQLSTSQLLRTSVVTEPVLTYDYSLPQFPDSFEIELSSWGRAWRTRVFSPFSPSQPTLSVKDRRQVTHVLGNPELAATIGRALAPFQRLCLLVVAFQNQAGQGKQPSRGHWEGRGVAQRCLNNAHGDTCVHSHT